MSNKEPIDAIFLYYGILDAYISIGKELIGENVVDDHVLPKMIYYVDNFLGNHLQGSEEEKTNQLKKFLKRMEDKINTSRESGKLEDLSIRDTWEIRAAIFGFESVFIDILGNDVIETYLIPRIAEILSFYLPDIFNNPELNLKEKLNRFSKYIEENNFVRNSSHSIKKDGTIEFRTNYCAFADIHESDAYLEGNTRFCPWGMMATAIAIADKARIELNESKFTTRGSITKLEVIN